MKEKNSLVLYLLKELITIFHKDAGQEDFIETAAYYTENRNQGARQQEEIESF